MYHPRNTPVGLSLSYLSLATQPHLPRCESAKPPGSLLALSHPTGHNDPNGHCINARGDTPFWVVALVILMTSPPPSPLTIGNHTEKNQFHQAVVIDHGGVCKLSFDSAIMFLLPDDHFENFGLALKQARKTLELYKKLRVVKTKRNVEEFVLSGNI
jgi:hypothetical protein